jgi:hypothetical protein
MPQTFSELIGIFLDLIQAIVPVIMGLAFLAFVWGLVKFIFRVGGDEKAVGEGKNFMIWSVIALFIMISIWGIISFFRGEFGFGNSLGLPLLPE